jgi:hypothetical protein
VQQADIWIVHPGWLVGVIWVGRMFTLSVCKHSANPLGKIMSLKINTLEIMTTAQKWQKLVLILRKLLIYK